MADIYQKQSARKIAVFLPSLRGGGAERAMLTLANGIAARGYAVDLVLAKREGPYLSDVSDEVRIVDLKARRVIYSMPGLIRYLRRGKPAAMLSGMGHVNLVAVVARALAQVPTRIVVSERNNLSVADANAANVRDRAIRHLIRWVYPRADGIVAVSGGVAEDLARSIGIPRAAVDVVYNPVVSATLYARSQEHLLHPWLVRKEPRVVLGAGRLTKQKDFPTLIKAFAKVRGSRDLRLLILGEGEARSELEVLIRQLGIEDYVSLPGFTENPFAVMRRSSLFVLSSAWEGLPNVLIQAMACGTPVVSTDCPSGPAEILEAGKWGRLVPVGDVDAMATAMLATLDASETADATSRAKDFNLDRAVEGYLKVLLPGVKH